MNEECKQAKQNIHFSRTCILTIAARIAFETHETYGYVIQKRSSKDYLCEYNMCKKTYANMET